MCDFYPHSPMAFFENFSIFIRTLDQRLWGVFGGPALFQVALCLFWCPHYLECIALYMSLAKNITPGLELRLHDHL